MTPNGILQGAQGSPIQSFVKDETMYIKADDHFRLVANYREQIADLKKAKTREGRLIGISGLAGSGKSTIANILVTDHGFVRVRFADTLKTMLCTLLLDAGLDEKTIHAAIEGELKGETLKALGWKTPRFAMQTLGTEWGRDLLGQNIWADIAKSKISKLIARGDRVVVDDVRFQNEVDVIGELGGDVLRVSRDTNTKVEPHQSEFQELDSAKHTILNNGSVSDLKQLIAKYI